MYADLPNKIYLQIISRTLSYSILECNEIFEQPGRRIQQSRSARKLQKRWCSAWMAFHRERTKMTNSSSCAAPFKMYALWGTAHTASASEKRRLYTEYRATFQRIHDSFIDHELETHVICVSYRRHVILVTCIFQKYVYVRAPMHRARGNNSCGRHQSSVESIYTRSKWIG